MMAQMWFEAPRGKQVEIKIIAGREIKSAGIDREEDAGQAFVKLEMAWMDAMLCEDDKGRSQK